MLNEIMVGLIQCLALVAIFGGAWIAYRFVKGAFWYFVREPRWQRENMKQEIEWLGNRVAKLEKRPRGKRVK